MNWYWIGSLVSAAVFGYLLNELRHQMKREWWEK